MVDQIQLLIPWGVAMVLFEEVLPAPFPMLLSQTSMDQTGPHQYGGVHVDAMVPRRGLITPRVCGAD